MPTFDTPEPIAVRVDAATGCVRLVATDRTDTVVAVRPHDESCPADVRAAEQTRVHYGDGKLSVDAGRRGLDLFRGGAVAIDIALPSGCRLKVAVASADVCAKGEFDDCRISTASGDLDLEHVQGNLKVSTASGSITTVAIDGNASVSTASGNATIGQLDGDLIFKGASGGLSVARLCGGLRAQTASGSVIVATAIRGAISAQTSSGAVGVGVAEGTAARLDLVTGSGAVTNLLESADGPAEGEDTLQIQARAGSGDIEIYRAAPTRSVTA